MLNDVEPLLGQLGNYVEYIPPLTQEKVVKPSVDMVEVVPDEEYTGLSRVTINGVTSDIDSNIVPENIKLGISILGVNGNVIEKPSDEWGISDARYLFYGNARLDIINELLSRLKDCTNFYGMFSNARNLEETPSFDSSKGTNFSRIFEYCYGLKKVNYLDTSNGTDFSNMFYYCNNLTEIPQIDTSNGTNFREMFCYCSKLENIPQIDTSNGTNFYWMFGGVLAKTIPLLDTSKGEEFGYMFLDSKVTEIPQLNTSNGTSFYWMFADCRNLVSVPLLDTSKAVRIIGMFRYSYELTTLGGLKDLGKAYLTTQSANDSDYKLDLSYCSKLTYDSLMNVINNLYDIASIGVKSQQLVLGSTNMAKLSAEEIQIATDKGWTVS